MADIKTELKRLQDAKAEFPEILHMKGVTVSPDARLDEMIDACYQIRYPYSYICTDVLYEGLTSGLQGPKGFRQSISSQHVMKLSLDRFLRNLLGMNQSKPNYRDSMNEITWEDVQYYLIHGEWASNISVLNGEAKYYWWKDGGVGAPVAYTAGVEDTNVRELAEALFCSGVNNNAHALDNLTVDDLASFRFVKDGTASSWAEIGRYTADDLATFKEKAGKLFNDVYWGRICPEEQSGTKCKLLNWYQIQHYLLTGEYLDLETTELDYKAEYWWRWLDYDYCDPANADVPTPLDEFLDAINVYIAAGLPTLAADENRMAFDYMVESLFVTAKMNMRWQTTASSRVFKTFDAGDVTTIASTTTKTRMRNLAKVLGTKLDGTEYYQSSTGKVNLTWYQLQYYAYNMNNILGTATTIVSPQDAYDYYVNTLSGDWCPRWAKCDKPLTTMLKLMTAYAKDPATGEAPLDAFLTFKNLSQTVAPGNLQFKVNTQKILTNISDTNLVVVKNRIKSLASQAYATPHPGDYDEPSGLLSLSWYQIQDKLETNSNYRSKDKAIHAVTRPWSPPYWLETPLTTGGGFETLALGAFLSNKGVVTALNYCTVHELTSLWLKGSDGSDFADTPENLSMLKSRVKAAAQDVSVWKNITWDQVQYAIINGAAAADAETAETASKEQYWWKDGGEKVTGWGSLLTAAKLAIYEGRTANLNTIVYVDGGAEIFYFRNKDQSVMTLEQFKTAVIGAATAAGEKYVSMDWESVQYYVMHDMYPRIASDTVHESNEQYWWKNGGTKVVDLPSLLLGAKQAVGGRNAILNTLTDDKMAWVTGDRASGDDTELYLRGSYNGAPIFDMPNFKARLKAMATSAKDQVLSLTWEQVQCYMLNPKVVDADMADQKSRKFFWWKNGGEKPDPMMTFAELLVRIVDMRVRRIIALSELEDMLDIDELRTVLCLRKDTTGAEYTLAELGSLSALLNAMFTKANAYPEYYDKTTKILTLTWAQVQHFLITKTIVADDGTLGATYTWGPPPKLDRSEYDGT